MWQFLRAWLARRRIAKIRRMYDDLECEKVALQAEINTIRKLNPKGDGEYVLAFATRLINAEKRLAYVTTRLLIMNINFQNEVIRNA